MQRYFFVLSDGRYPNVLEGTRTRVSPYEINFVASFFACRRERKKSRKSLREKVRTIFRGKISRDSRKERADRYGPGYKPLPRGTDTRRRSFFLSVLVSVATRAASLASRSLPLIRQGGR